MVQTIEDEETGLYEKARAGPYSLMDKVYVGLSVGMVILQLVSTYHMFQGTVGQQNTHLMLALVIVFLHAFRKARRSRWLFPVFIVLSLLGTVYVQILQEELEFTTGMGRADAYDMAIGIILIIMPLVACLFAFGKPLVITAILFLGYIFLGQYLPPAIGHGGFTLERIILRLSISLNSGVYGLFLQASLSYVYLFIVFGAVLQITGGTEFFMTLARLVGKRVRGGAAQTAVVGSGLLGMICGSPMANVAITGAYTIPAMKASGFSPHLAGAVEAAASTGGQIMPPVMGAAAFLMAAILGVPYSLIMVIAFIPAFLYYFSCFSYIFFAAGRWRIDTYPEVIDFKELLLRAPLFIIPLGLLVYLLLAGFTVMMGAFWAIMSSYLLSLMRKKTRPSLRQTLDGLTAGAVAGCGIAVTCSVLGIMTTTMTMTGLGLRIPYLLQTLSGGYLVPALLLGFIAALILGCGLHTVAVYTIVAMTIAPGLIAMGVPQITAHFFLLYGGVFADVTPPVAMAVLVATGIAKSNFWLTAAQAVKIALPGFLLPFAFIWCPPLMGKFTNPWMDVLAIFGIAAALCFIAAALAGYLIIVASRIERSLLAFAGIAFFAFSFTYNLLFLLMAGILVAVTAMWQVLRQKKLAFVPAAADVPATDA